MQHCACLHFESIPAVDLIRISFSSSYAQILEVGGTYVVDSRM